MVECPRVTCSCIWDGILRLNTFTFFNAQKIHLLRIDRQSHWMREKVHFFSLSSLSLSLIALFRIGSGCPRKYSIDWTNLLVLLSVVACCRCEYGRSRNEMNRRLRSHHCLHSCFIRLTQTVTIGMVNCIALICNHRFQNSMGAFSIIQCSAKHIFNVGKKICKFGYLLIIT